MPTIDDVLSWKPETLATVSDALLKKRKALVDLQDEVDASDPPPTWRGDASVAAGKEHEKMRQRLLDITAEVGQVFSSVDFAETEVKDAKKALEDALQSAKDQGFEVDHKTGVVTDPKTYEDERDAQDAGRKVKSVAGQIKNALDQAKRADDDLAKALTAANDGKIDGGTGDLSDAAGQMPMALKGMTPEEIAKKYGKDVAMLTVNFWLEGEVEFASFELEGKATASYVVMADGTVRLKLALEAGLGREIDVGGAEVDASAGAATELELKFDSPDEAQAFLNGLDDAAFDLSVGDAGNVSGAVAKNVADYVMKEEITSFKTGLYGKVEGEFDSPWMTGEASGRVDGYYDWATKQAGLKFTGKVEGDIGSQDSGASGSAELSAEAKFKDGEPEEVVFTGKMTAAMANEKLDIPLNTGSTGAGVDVQIKMSRTNEAFGAFNEAMSAGDVDKATAIAMDQGEVVTRTTSVEQYSSGEVDVDAGPLGGVEVQYGADGEAATSIWVRPANKDYTVPVQPGSAP